MRLGLRKVETLLKKLGTLTFILNKQDFVTTFTKLR